MAINTLHGPHVHFAGVCRFTCDEEEHEPLTNFLTVFFGAEVNSAKAVLHGENWWTELTLPYGVNQRVPVPFVQELEIVVSLASQIDPERNLL